MKHGNHRRSLAAICSVLLIAGASVALADFDQGMNYFKTGKYVEAAAEFQAIVDQAPNYDYGYYMLGLSFVKMKKPSEAVTNFKKAIQLNGDRFEYHDGLAKAYFYARDYPKAIATLRASEGLASGSQAKYSLYSLRGFAYAALEKWSEAVNDLEQAKALRSDSNILVQLGKAYYKLGHNDQAASNFRQAVRAVPNDDGSWMLLAESLINLGAESRRESQKQAYYNEAVQASEKYQTLKPQSYEAHNLIGRAALGARNYPKAEQAFRRVLAQKPNYCYAMVNLGKTYLAMGSWNQAEGILTDAASCAPRMPVIYESLGFAVQKQKRLPEAIGYYQKAYDLKPSESIRLAIDTCRKNIEIEQHNIAIEEEKKQQALAEQQAREEYERELAKQREWEERRRRDQ